MVIWCLTRPELGLHKTLWNGGISCEFLAASQHAATTFRNVEVLASDGNARSLARKAGRASICATWVGRHEQSDRAGALLASTKFFRTFLQVILLGTGGYLAIHRQISPGGIVAESIIIGRALQPMNWQSAIGRASLRLEVRTGG